MKLIDVMCREFDDAKEQGREEAAWAILALLVRKGIEHDPGEILRAAGIAKGAPH